MARNETSFKPGHKGMGGRPRGSVGKTTIEVREFARRLIEDPEYQASVRGRMIAGKAPQMEMLLFHHAYGKPVERHEVNAHVRAAGPDDPELRSAKTGGEDHSGRNLRIDGWQVTPEGAERLRKIMGGLMDKLNKEGAKAKAAGELPSTTTPAGMPA